MPLAFYRRPKKTAAFYLFEKKTISSITGSCHTNNASQMPAHTSIEIDD